MLYSRPCRSSTSFRTGRNWPPCKVYPHTEMAGVNGVICSWPTTITKQFLCIQLMVYCKWRFTVEIWIDLIFKRSTILVNNLLCIYFKVWAYLTIYKPLHDVFLKFFNRPNYWNDWQLFKNSNCNLLRALAFAYIPKLAHYVLL